MYFNCVLNALFLSLDVSLASGMWIYTSLKFDQARVERRRKKKSISKRSLCRCGKYKDGIKDSKSIKLKAKHYKGTNSGPRLAHEGALAALGCMIGRESDILLAFLF